MTQKHTHNTRQQGFTLTEIAIVLGIVGLIIGVIWGAAASVYNNFRLSKAVTETLVIVQNFKAFYGMNNTTQAPNGSDITTLAIEAGLFPAEMIQSGNTSYAVGPWSGSQVNVYSGSTVNAITVAFWNLNQTVCNRLGDAIATGTAFPADGLIWEGINDTGRNLPPYGTDAPFSPTDVAAACASGGNNVQITYSVN